MPIRTLPVLCAGLMLAACAGSGLLRSHDDGPVPETTSGILVPGTTSDGPDGNVGNTIYFDTDSAVLVPDAQLSLQKQAAWLAAFPQFKIIVEGHADERGTREYNLALGERRAQATMNYLVALGLDPARVKTISYGKEHPVCSEAAEDCWSRNRRTVSTIDE